MQFTPKNRKDWRDWLRKNHDSKPEVWVVFFKKTSPKTNLSYNDAVEEALCFGWVDGMKRSIDEHRYMHRFSPRKPDSKWSPSNIERVQRMLDAGLMTAAGEKAIAQAKESGSWEQPVTSPGPLPMPPEFDQQTETQQEGAVFLRVPRAFLPAGVRRLGCVGKTGSNQAAAYGRGPGLAKQRQEAGDAVGTVIFGIRL